MRGLVLLCLLYFLSPFNLLAQSSSEILAQLKKLEKTGSVLYIAAHPDDENTRLLGYLANERMMRTGYLSLTRGDGGQNLIGNEQGTALGLIRTNELMAARGIDKAEQFFSRAYDFGYSKNPEETFTFWNHDSVLADVVWVIRNFRPDVIICRFPTTGEGGHGHHTASAILAEEAFDAAADPNMFPEQLKYVGVWQAKRVMWNTFNFGGNNTTSEDQIKVDVGAYNVLLGRSYGEIAAESRSQHKSQGFGSSAQRGFNLEYFKNIKGEPATNDIFDGVDVNWSRISAAKGIAGEIKKAIGNFKADDPAASIAQLKVIHQKLCALEESNPSVKYWKELKIAEVEQIILSCAGIFIEANPNEHSVVPGDSLAINLNIIARNHVSVFLQEIDFNGEKVQTNTDLEWNKNASFKHNMIVPSYLSNSNPYWLNQPHSLGEFVIDNQLLIGKPLNDPAMSCRLKLNVEGLPVQVAVPVEYKYTDPVRGELHEPIELLPSAHFAIEQSALICLPGESKTLDVTLHANTSNFKCEVNAKASEGWKVTIENPIVDLTNKGDEAILHIQLTAPNDQSVSELNLQMIENGKVWDKAMKRIEYDHIPPQFILNNAAVKLVAVDVKTTAKKIGYIEGAGDAIPAALKQMGCAVDILTESQILNDQLSSYDAIITGVRAYNTNDRMVVYYEHLMKYVSEGGNLLVQYNTNNRIGPLKSKIGPYPFGISRDRVTDETANVTFLMRDHPAYKTPNVLSSSDFDGWIQERGIYFATEVDEKYTLLFGMADKGEEMLKTSTIVTPYGKGNFVYTGISFFRELPAGVPGAFRLFANLISLPKGE